jgi:outer membrane cobalamin receptor
LKGLFIILSLLALPVFTIAQAVMDTIRIGEVQIFGRYKTEDTGLKISRPDSMAMVSSLTSQLSDLLTLNTPLFIKSYGRGSVATASFRGTSSTHTQLVWNGMSLNSPMRGSADLSLLPVMFIDEAWLLHGGSSMSENSGALGGSIHLANKADWTVANSLSVLFERGSFNSGVYLGRFQTGKGRFRSVTRLMYDHSGNNYPYYNVGVLPFRQDTLRNAEYNKWAALQEFYLLYGTDNQVVFRTWYQQSDRNLPQLMSYEGDDRIEFQKDNQFRAQVEAKNYKGRVKYHYSTGLNRTKLQYHRSSSTTRFVNDDAKSNENSVSGRLKAIAGIGNGLMITSIAELNYHWVEVSNPVRKTHYDEDRLESGLMVNLQYKPSEKWGLSALIRSEWYDNQLVPIVPSLGAEYLIPGTFPLWIKVNGARNYHKPSLNDLYWTPGGNPDLQAEDGVMADFTLVQTSRDRETFRQEVSVFYSLIDNWILWQPAASGAWYWEAANVKEVFSRGLEYQFSSKTSLQKIKFQFSGNYAYTVTTNENSMNSVDLSRGKQLIYIPKHTGNLHGAASYSGWTVKSDINYTGRRYTMSSNEWSFYESVLNPFWMVQATLEKVFQGPAFEVIARLRAHNLLNIDYQQILWRPMPKRNYSLSIALRWTR